MASLCQRGRIFRRCHEQPVAVCQYCGRDFCERHAGLRVGEDEVCDRPICLLKHADIANHLAYRAAATERGQRGLCGELDCPEPRAGQCSKCHALFCEQHLQERDEIHREGIIAVKRPVSACAHCGARIKLWSRM